jgi:hypothetical protein
MTTRTLNLIRIHIAPNGDFSSIEIVGTIANQDVNNPQLDFSKQRGLALVAGDLTAGQQTAVQDFVDSVAAAVVNTHDPIA